MPRYIFIFIVTTLLCSHKQSFAQHNSIKDSIQTLSLPAKGTVGVALMNLQSLDTLSVNGYSHFPMQSVMKFPLAVTVLHLVDEKKLNLNQNIHFNKNDLPIPVSSPIRNKYPEGNVDLTLAEVLTYTVAQSDNNGCDKLFELIGGPKVVNDYVHSIGIKDISIIATEREMGMDWQTQYHNWCTPKAMLQLLVWFNKGGTLSKTSRAFLWSIMAQPLSAPKRIKGLLPPGTAVAHKAGTSGTNNSGLTAATNDVGIVELPNKQRFAIAVFISDAKADSKTREETIARIAKSVWDYYIR